MKGSLKKQIKKPRIIQKNEEICKEPEKNQLL